MAQDSDAGNHGSHGCSAARIEGVYDGAVFGYVYKKQASILSFETASKEDPIAPNLAEAILLNFQVRTEALRGTLYVDRQAGKGNARNH